MFLPLLGLLGLTAALPLDTCRCLPSDACWPSLETWNALNETVSGRLVASTPLGSVCHDPDYDMVKCLEIQDQWDLPATHLPSSSSVMQAYFANQSCDPFTPREWPCTLGNYVSYAVDVASTDDIVAALDFVRENNIRLVVRNTGHDFLGRSTGAGALAIWTAHLKAIEITTWSDDLYDGPALKAAAGVLGAEAVEAANDAGLVVVTGECPTVGIAGGFSQGGGHSMLSTNFGLAADQVLEYEVVTAAGKIVTASRTKNPDLFWAMTGGGGGTFGIATSITVRAYEALSVGGASLQLTSVGLTADAFKEVAAEFHSTLLRIVDAGGSAVWVYRSGYISFQPVTVFNSTGDKVRDEVLAPLTSFLSERLIPFAASYTTHSYRDHYDEYLGPLPGGNVLVDYQFGSRLIPRSLLEDTPDVLMGTLHNLTAAGVLAVGTAGKFVAPEGVRNSVLPAWRDAVAQLQLLTTWEPTDWAGMLGDQLRITEEYNPQMVAITPGGGAYMNEADFREPNWQEEWYGVNYKKLCVIKKTWDPEGLFWSLKTPGSEMWTVAEDGRMCRA